MSNWKKILVFVSGFLLPQHITSDNVKVFNNVRTLKECKANIEYIGGTKD